MTTTGLPAIDYTSRDFAGFRESLLTFAAERAPEWRSAATGDPNDLGVVLAEMFAYEGDVLSYYTDRVANEAFLQTATQRQSVLNHAAVLDYTPQSATGSVVPVTMSVTTSNLNVTIPAGFKLSTAPQESSASEPGSGSAPNLSRDNAPVVFETTVPITFAASTARDANGGVLPARTSITVIAQQGETVLDEVIATLCADPNASYTLAQAPVISGSVVIRVVERPGDAGQVWFRVGNLLDAGPLDNAYQLTIDAEDAVTITMGDGVNGRIAPRGSVLHARYRVGGGSEGNVPDGTLTEVVDPEDIRYTSPTGTPLGESDQLAPTELVAVNLQPARGGTDSESLESIRANAPRARRTNGRAVSLRDYEVLAVTVPGVQIAKAKAVARVYTNVTLYLAPPGGDQPSQQTLNAVIDYLLPRKMAGVTVVAATPTYVPIDISLNVIVDSRFSQETVRQAVNSALQGVLAFDNVGFGERVALSTVYATAIRVQGVINVSISRMARTSGAVGAADVSLADNELPIIGTFALTAEGGVVNSAGAAGAAATPTASTQPQLRLLRCDPNSTHVELTWSPGANTTYWDVEVEYRTTAGVVSRKTVLGPFSFGEASFDLPRIGGGVAQVLAFRTLAFNGNTGPVASAFATTPYVCE